jgi:hypothetical protein
VPAPFRVLAALAALYLIYAAVIFFTQRSLLYPGRSRPAPEQIPHRAGFERHWLELESGPVEAWLLLPLDDEARTGAPLNRTAAPAMIFFHGNGELIDEWPPLFEGLRREGIVLFLVEFPGYGRSSGTPTQASIIKAAVAAYDLLASRADVDCERIVAAGRSLGGGAACALAERRSIAALLLFSTFTSVRPFAKGYLVPGFLAVDPFENDQVLRVYDGPCLLIHGRHDDTIPYSHGEELAALAKRARFVAYECGHNDFPPDLESWWDDMADFLRSERILPP